ncbi:MAG TPA: adenylate/guanylate cyclase domain-containing protein [Chloroflexota bacterium]
MAEERKLVAVLFADVTGSTGLGEDLDPEDVRALMGRYYEHARRVILEHGGSLEKFIGDAVMALFGIPNAHGDDAERAVAAALALQHAIGGDPFLEAIEFRVGVNSGEVVATTERSRGDFLVTGDAVNVAARLQQAASPGEVLVSERVYQAAQAAFHFGDARTIAVKGRREPVRVYTVTGTREVRQMGHPRLIGRKRELTQLSLLQASALEERRPQLVSVLAPAGTGKTRLLEEFLSRLDPDEGWRVGTGRSLSYGQTLTYWPLRGLLEDLLGAVERDRVVDALRQGGIGAGDAERLADLILATLGIESTTLTDPESVFNAWRLLIEALAREAPLIVVFEDLHWASDSLLDLVEHLMHPRSRTPLLIVATSRPELLDRRPTWGGGGQSFTALALQPLSDDQTADLVESLGVALPPAIRQSIVERAGGNPFFATELTRGLVERGVSANARPGDMLPDTVHGAVLARLDLLSREERTVLQAASVGGRSFRPAAVACLLPNGDWESIQQSLDGLLERDLITPGDEGWFVFRHVLIRDVAYGTLSRAERVRMHAAFAEWLESVAADRLDEFVGLVAYHYREAVLLSRRSAVPLPLPFEAERAVYFLERAGELASRSGAFSEACSQLQSAIDIVPAEQQARLYEKLGDFAGWAGDVVLNAYQQALQRWRDAGAADPLTGARLLRKILTLHMRWLGTASARPTREEMSAMREEGQRLADEVGDEDERRRLQVADLFWPFWERVYYGTDITPDSADRQAAIGLSAAEYFKERGDWSSYSEALDGYAASVELVGRYDAMLDAAQRRLEIPQVSAFERGDALAMVVRAHYHLAQYDAAVDTVHHALASVRPEETTIYIAHSACRAALAAWIYGRWSDIDLLGAVIRDAEQEQPHDRALRMGFWPMVWLGVAREDEVAVEVASSALHRLMEWEGEVERVAGRSWIDACAGDDPRSLDLDHIVQAFGNNVDILADVLSFLSEHGVTAPGTFLEHAARQAEIGRDTRLVRLIQVARELSVRDTTALATAIDEAEKHGFIPHAARMRIVLGEMTDDPEQLEQARQVLQRLKDLQYLRRLDEVAVAAGR